MHDDSRDLLTVVLPQGKYRFTCLPQGLVFSTDYFNLHTDPSIRKEEGYRKNVDDILTSATSVKQLEERLKKLLTLCRNRNMKLSPSKFQIGSSVVFGGTVIEAQHQKGDSKKTVFLSPTQQKLDAFLDFPTPSCKKDVQSIMGAAAQLNRWTPGLMLLSPNLQNLTGNSTPFFWNNDLQKELDGMKVALRQIVKLTPLDTSKDLLVWSDAAPSEGMAHMPAQ